MMKLLTKRISTAFLLFAILISLFSMQSCAMASFTIYPAQTWTVSSPEQQGMQSFMIAGMMQQINENSIEIHSVLIVRHGKLVLDAYFWPFSAEMKHILHSCTKSIMSTLIGIAVDKEYIQSVNQPILDFLPNLAEDKDGLKDTISLENLLMMSSGLDCRDSYLYSWAGLHAMCASSECAQYVHDIPMVVPPGSKFEYCNGLSYLLSVIIQNATTMKTLDFAIKYLFEPLGIKDIS